MKQQFVKREGNRRLILIFAGWAMDEQPFLHVSRPGYDTMVVWDYRDLSADWSEAARYGEIAVIAWSMGVYAASMTVHSIDHLITARIAVNGTMTPVDDRLGIPRAMFEGTLATLNERNLQKFFRRMCGDRPTTDRFLACPPRRDFAGLAPELRAIYPEPWFANPKVGKWDTAVIGSGDAIFPPANQERAWAGVRRVVVDRPHYIDLQEIAGAYIIDKDSAAGHFERGRSTYTPNASVQDDVAHRLTADLCRLGIDASMSSRGFTALEIGCGAGTLTRRLSALMPGGILHLWDTNSAPPDSIPGTRFTSCDAELQICRTPSDRFDLVASASTVQWFNSPARFLRECLRTLRPGGILAFSCFYRGNMHELAAASGVGLPLPSPGQWRDMIPHGFDILSDETRDYDLTFDSPVDVLRHLRLTGVNSLGNASRGGSGPAFVSRYPRMLDGLCHLTYRTIRFILKKSDNG